MEKPRKTLLIGKNSFFAKGVCDATMSLVSHREVGALNFALYDRVVIASFPPDYRLRIEKRFQFEKKILQKVHPNTLVQYLSTSKVYANRLGCSEDDTPNPQNIYAENKLAIEILLAQCHENVQILRLSNLFSQSGGAEGTFIALLIENWYKTRRVEFNISPASLRDFMPLTRVQAMLNALYQAKARGVFNLSSGIGLRVDEIVTHVLDLQHRPHVLERARWGDGVVDQTLSHEKVFSVLPQLTKITKKFLLTSLAAIKI